MKLAMVVVLAVAGMAWGQVPPEEAQRRLEAKQGAPDPAAMRLEIDKLRRELAGAMQEIANLRSENLKLRVAATQRAVVADSPKLPFNQRQLKIGMTLAEANEAMGVAGKLVGADAGGEERYSWEFRSTGQVVGTTYIPPQDMGGFFAILRGGKVASFSRREGVRSGDAPIGARDTRATGQER